MYAWGGCQPQNRLVWLRAALLREVASGLAVVATPLTQLGRPLRTQALLAKAENIGRLAWELVHCPGQQFWSTSLGICWRTCAVDGARQTPADEDANGTPPAQSKEQRRSPMGCGAVGTRGASPKRHPLTGQD